MGVTPCSLPHGRFSCYATLRATALGLVCALRKDRSAEHVVLNKSVDLRVSQVSDTARGEGTATFQPVSQRVSISLSVYRSAGHAVLPTVVYADSKRIATKPGSCTSSREALTLSSSRKTRDSPWSLHFILQLLSKHVSPRGVCTSSWNVSFFATHVQISMNFCSIAFHENPLNGSQVAVYGKGRTDGHGLCSVGFVCFP